MTRETLIERSKTIEKELICRIFFDTKHAIRASTLISADDFQQYGQVFTVLVQSHIDGKNVTTELQQIGYSASQFMNDSFRKVESICKDLKDVSNAIRVHHTLLSATENITYENVDSYVSDVQREIMNSVHSAEKESTSMAIIAEDWRKLRDMYIEKKKSGKELIGISCGYSKIDNIIDGLRPGHLWIMGGYTSMGKTFASLNIVANLIKQGKRVVYYSIEMTAPDIVSRIIGILTRQNGKSLIKGYGDQVTADSAMQELIKSNLSIHTTKSSLAEIKYSMLEETMGSPVDFFAVDYLQLVQVKGLSEYAATTICAIEFQQMAKQLGVPTMLLSQISNDGAKNASDVVMSFKGSGAIAAAADLAIEIKLRGEAEEYKRNLQEGKPVEMKWQVMKNRHGAVGAVDMIFTGNTGIFEQDTAFEEF